MDAAVPMVALDQEKYDPAKAREGVRSELAKGLVLLLAVVVIGPYILILGGVICDAIGSDTPACNRLPGMTLKEATDTLLTPLVGLVGAVTGFYFGENKSS